MKERAARLIGLCAFILALSGVSVGSIGFALQYGLKEQYLPRDMIFMGVILYASAFILAVFFTRITGYEVEYKEVKDMKEVKEVWKELKQNAFFRAVLLVIVIGIILTLGYLVFTDPIVNPRGWAIP